MRSVGAGEKEGGWLCIFASIAWPAVCPWLPAATNTGRRQIAKAWDLNWSTTTTTHSNWSKEMRRVISLLKSETSHVTRLLYQSTIASNKTKDSAEFLALFPAASFNHSAVGWVTLVWKNCKVYPTRLNVWDLTLGFILNCMNGKSSMEDVV